MTGRMRPEDERWLRRVATTAAHRQPPEPEEPAEPTSGRTDQAAGAEDDVDPGLRLEQKAVWVDLQIQRAIARGDFDNLPGAGKPIRDLSGTHDPDWWAKRLIEREQVTGLLPPALALRKEDVELETVLDREATERGVRRAVEDFNHRVVEARRQLLGGPPVITPTRDVDEEVAAWRARRDERRARQRAELEAWQTADAAAAGRRRRWLPWRRGRSAG
jgi:hypothetical protein